MTMAKAKTAPKGAATISKVPEFKTTFVWLPDLSGRPEEERLRVYGEIVARTVGGGWVAAEESLGLLHLPSEHLDERTLDGVPGWTTRVEVTRMS